MGRVRGRTARVALLVLAILVLVLVPSVPALAKIFLGEIKRWNDPATRRLNPGLSLPSSSSYVVHRSDASGTTWIFTYYLSAVSSTWKSKVGADKSVKWPVGIGGKGNEGVTALVKAAKGRIGCVEYAYALQSRVPWAQMKNKAGYWVQPSLSNFAAAAAGATWSAKNVSATILVNASGAKSWTIAGASFVLTRSRPRTTGRPAPCTSSGTGPARTARRGGSPRSCTT